MNGQVWNANTGQTFGANSRMAIEMLFRDVPGLEQNFAVDPDHPAGWQRFTGDKVRFAQQIVPNLDAQYFEPFRPIFEFIQGKVAQSWSLLAKMHLHLAETKSEPLDKAQRREIARLALETDVRYFVPGAGPCGPMGVLAIRTIGIAPGIMRLLREPRDGNCVADLGGLAYEPHDDR